MSKSHASALFLAVLLIGWTAIGFLAGSAVCMVGGMSTITRITVLLCSSGYSGLISDSSAVFYICTEQVPVIPLKKHLLLSFLLIHE